MPDHVYWGVETSRARENFAITDAPLSELPSLVRGLAAVKEAAAIANRELRLLPEQKAEAIIAACKEIRHGAWSTEFVVDVLQGGAGTSTNMNANEVIANRALELLGRKRGSYDVLDPHDHVNLCQSTNDVYPTAVRIALIVDARRLRKALARLAGTYCAKAREFADLPQVGRTQLQDAVPLMLGQQFATYALGLDRDRRDLDHVIAQLAEINLGGTAIGTGIGAHPEFGSRARAHLASITGLPLRAATNLIEATQDTSGVLALSGALRRIAVRLSKQASDLRLLASGPRAGLGELMLPAVQPGSSIMPGKVNPVIPEMVNQVAFHAIGSDVTVTLAAEAGQLQLNAFMPLIAYELLTTLKQLAKASQILGDRCVAGVAANADALEANLARSASVATSLTARLGHAGATQLVNEALSAGKNITDVLITADERIAVLSPGGLPVVPDDAREGRPGTGPSAGRRTE